MLDQYEARGLYDSRAPGAAGRLELLEWLRSRGVTLDQMTEADGRAAIVELAGELELSKGGRISADDVAQTCGTSVEDVCRVMRTAGLPSSAHGVTVPARMAETYLGIQAGMSIFGEAAVLRFLRVLGTAASAVAEAANWTFLSDLEARIVAADAGELALAKANVEAIGLLDLIPEVMETLLRAHVDLAIRRSLEARQRAVYDAAGLAVGFVDLVGFTPLSSSLERSGLAQLLDEFEERSIDVVAEHDGRVVKLVGDAVMFVAVDPADACRMAIDLVAAFPEERVDACGGIAFGEVLARGGDYFGPVVNAAARVADQASARDVLITSEVVAALVDHDDLDTQPAGRRNLKGFPRPVELWEVRWRSSGPSR